MKLICINGVNLNLLGIREKNIYGEKTYKDLKKSIKTWAKESGVKIKVVCSNSESKIVEYIQKAYRKFDGIIINAGAYTHTSIAILDALKGVAIETVEVHLSDINSREEYRAHSYIKEYASLSVVGQGFLGYKKAIEYFATRKQQTEN